MMFSGTSGFFCEARMILRSVSRFCRPSRSSTTNQPLAFSASISMLAAPWVTLVENELAGVGLYCPVWSRKPYTTAIRRPLGRGMLIRS